MAAGGAMAAGVISSAIGSWLKSKAAKMKQQRLKTVINEPGINLESTGKEALTSMEGLRPQAQELGSNINLYNQSELENALNASIPGYNTLQTTRTQQAIDFMKGRIPKDVQDAVLQSDAAKAMTRGYGGSGMARNLVSRDLGLTSLDLTGRGQQLAQGIISGTPRATPVDVTSWLGLTPTAATSLRSHERDQKLQALMAYANAPGATQVMGDEAAEYGKMLMGMGSGMMGGMGGGGGGAGAINTTGTSGVMLNYPNWGSGAGGMFSNA